MKKLTPVLVVDAIEPCLPFWVDRLGFTRTIEGPEDGRLGFVALQKDGVEVMVQTRSSVVASAPGMEEFPFDGPTHLYIEVSDFDAVERALEGASGDLAPTPLLCNRDVVRDRVSFIALFRRRLLNEGGNGGSPGFPVISAGFLVSDRASPATCGTWACAAWKN